MSPKQWDALLAEIYEAGGTLIELNHRERPVRAYRRLVTSRANNKTTASG